MLANYPLSLDSKRPGVRGGTPGRERRRTVTFPVTPPPSDTLAKLDS